jgi:hypothetical protein
MLHTTFARAKEAHACFGSYHKFAKFKGGVRKWGKDTPFPLSEVVEVCGLDDALWALKIVLEKQEGDRIARVFACDCAERALPIFEKEYPNDKRPRLAIEVARHYASGQATEEQLTAARAAALAAAAEAAAGAAAEAAEATAWAAAKAAEATAWAAAKAAEATAWAVCWDGAWDAEWEWQKKRFIELLDSIPNPELLSGICTEAKMIKTHRELHGLDPEVGYEWDAGNTPPGDSAPGRWTVRREDGQWVVLFHSFKGPEYVITTFAPTEDGERAAKTMALKSVEIAWGRWVDNDV